MDTFFMMIDSLEAKSIRRELRELLCSLRAGGESFAVSVGGLIVLACFQTIGDRFELKRTLVEVVEALADLRSS
jgi:hypothetical protein